MNKQFQKVIDGLEICSQHGSLTGLNCSGYFQYNKEHTDIERVNRYRDSCPYGECESGCVVTLAKDALAILKEMRESRSK